MLKASVVFHTFGSCTGPTDVATAALVVNHSVRTTQVSRDQHHRPPCMARCGNLGFPRAMVAHSFSTTSGLRYSPSLYTLKRSYTCKTFSNV